MPPCGAASLKELPGAVGADQPRYGRSQAHAAIAKAAATLGDQAPLDALMRTRLKELTGAWTSFWAALY